VTHHEDLSREQARGEAKIKARLRHLGIIRFDARLFTKSGNALLLDELKEPSVKLMLAQSFAVLNRLLEAETQAKQAMTAASKQFPEVSLLQTAPGASHYHRLPVCRLYPNAAPLFQPAQTLAIFSPGHHAPRIERQKIGSSALRQCRSRARSKMFGAKSSEAARRTKKDNWFKRFYERSLTNTKNAVHARLSAQRKILATLRERCGFQCSHIETPAIEKRHASLTGADGRFRLL